MCIPRIWVLNADTGVTRCVTGKNDFLKEFRFMSFTFKNSQQKCTLLFFDDTRDCVGMR